MAGGSDFQLAMEQFRADFARQLPERVQEAQGYLQASLANPDDEVPLCELHRVVHKLAGSCGTFGLREIGDTCLLYTSPSPRDGLLSRMPSSA